MGYLEQVAIAAADRRYRRPLLLLHGAWHGAWCWEAALRDFANRGFDVHAVSLRGHGGSDRPRGFNFCGIDDYVNDLSLAIAALEREPIVVGHSMGGFILQHYLMRRTLPGAVLLASIPLSGTLRFTGDWLLRHPLAVLSGLLSGDGRRLVGTPALAREAFFRPAIAPDELARHTARLGPESLRIAVADGIWRRPDPSRNSSPLLVIAAERDRVFTLDEQRRLAAGYGAGLTVIPEAAHDLMLDPAWPQAADAIERFAKLNDH